MILATVSTGWELICSLLIALIMNLAISLLLTAVMMALCIKGFADLKNEWKFSLRKVLPTEETDTRAEVLHDKLNTKP